MFFRSIFSLLSASLLFLAANTAPVTAPGEFLAVAPKVTSPDAGSVWMTSSKQTVKWDTSIASVPAAAQGYTVDVYLGHLTTDPTSENLYIYNPLAQKVPIMDGSCEITVPYNATTGNNYVVVVEGDSGNTAGPFTITQTPGDMVRSLL